MRKRIAVALTLLTTSLIAVATSASAADCASLTARVSSQTPRPIQFTGAEIGTSAMSVLWQTQMLDAKTATTRFGKVIGEDQNWLGTCQYPGIGIGAGSGVDDASRNVTLWVWADEVDISIARLSVLGYAGVIVTTTTTTSTTLPAAANSTTTTTTVPSEDLTAQVESSRAPVAAAASVAPVAAAVVTIVTTVAPAVQKVVQKKSKMKKTKTKTKKVTKKKAVKK
jgi:hypothetical protein